jgi:hypothetical protein
MISMVRCPLKPRIATAATTTPLSRSLVRITRRRDTRSTITPPNSSATRAVPVDNAKAVPNWTAEPFRART